MGNVRYTERSLANCHLLRQTIENDFDNPLIILNRKGVATQNQCMFWRRSHSAIIHLHLVTDYKLPTFNEALDILFCKRIVCANDVRFWHFSVGTVRNADNSSIVNLCMGQQNAFQFGRRNLGKTRYIIFVSELLLPK